MRPPKYMQRTPAFLRRRRNGSAQRRATGQKAEITFPSLLPDAKVKPEERNLSRQDCDSDHKTNTKTKKPSVSKPERKKMEETRIDKSQSKIHQMREGPHLNNISGLTSTEDCSSGSMELEAAQELMPTGSTPSFMQESV